MTERKRWWQARGFVASGAFVLTFVVIGAVTLLAGGRGGPAATAPGPAATRAAPRADDGCRALAGDQRVPLRAPAAHWDRVGDQRAPGSTAVGPARVAGHVRTCYARSATGAVFAAYGFFAAQWEYPGDTAMLRALTASGQVRDEAIRRGGSPPHDPSWSVALIGFRVRDYSPSAATVALAARAAPTREAAIQGTPATTRLAAVSVRLRWERGDWKVVAEPDGYRPEVIDSLAGLVPWSAP